MNQPRQGYAYALRTKPKATHDAALPAHSFGALAPTLLAWHQFHQHIRDTSPAAGPISSQALVRGRRYISLRAFGESGGECVPLRRHDAALGDEPAAQAGRRHTA